MIIVSVNRKEKYAKLLNQDGVSISSVTYTSLGYTNGYFIAEKNNKYGLLNSKGKEVLAFKYDYIVFKSPILIYAREGDNEVYINANDM